MEAGKRTSRPRMHNNRAKFEEEQIKKLAHSLTADSELKKTLTKKGQKRAKRRRKVYIIKLIIKSILKSIVILQEEKR